MNDSLRSTRGHETLHSTDATQTKHASSLHHHQQHHQHLKVFNYGDDDLYLKWPYRMTTNAPPPSPSRPIFFITSPLSHHYNVLRSPPLPVTITTTTITTTARP
ncbi:hypothetical protein E2C01_088857 [Portunus trituberculatus]|uniref:Uncharacterized protein n=1 Tax=Portunus trituberculatus TaxID=210409 RepID=A0A5B7JKQ2_PORTR|nr:hypothetical protein [Portunus trituberculatus]